VTRCLNPSRIRRGPENPWERGGGPDGHKRESRKGVKGREGVGSGQWAVGSGQGLMGSHFRLLEALGSAGGGSLLVTSQGSGLGAQDPEIPRRVSTCKKRQTAAERSGREIHRDSVPACWQGERSPPRHQKIGIHFSLTASHATQSAIVQTMSLSCPYWHCLAPSPTFKIGRVLG
jgi:hypothetical protein